MTSGSVRFSNTRFQGKSANCCQTKDERTGRDHSMTPPSTGRSPAMAESSVDFPQPDAPTIASDSPPANSIESRSMTGASAP